MALYLLSHLNYLILEFDMMFDHFPFPQIFYAFFVCLEVTELAV